MTLTFGSLFAGIGGLDLGLERAGMRCAWQVEIDDYATRVLAKHWPDVHRERDVRTCGAANLAPVDLICGGFPCQDISSIGQRVGIGGSRSGLWSEFARIIGEIRPRYTLLENVSDLLSRGLGVVLGDLAALRYDAEWHCVPAAAIGAPHRRDRIFIIAHAQSDGLEESAWQNGQPQRRVCVPGRMDALRGAWRHTEPAICRVADGVPHRVDRIRGLGNAVVPQVAEFIGRQIVAFEEVTADEMVTA